MSLGKGRGKERVDYLTPRYMRIKMGKLTLNLTLTLTLNLTLTLILI